MIGVKSAAVRLAPPTRAPSTSVDGKDVAGVAGLDRAAVKDAHRVGVVEPCGKVGADVAVHVADLLAVGGDFAGADGPDGFIGDDGVRRGGCVGDRSPQAGCRSRRGFHLLRAAPMFRRCRSLR